MIDMFFWVLVFILWLLTVIVGAKKGIGCLGAILGFIPVFGLIIILLLPGDRVKCPYCKECIDKQAVKCPKCQSPIEPKSKRTSSKVSHLQSTQPEIVNDSSNHPGTHKGTERILNKINMDKYVNLDCTTLHLIRNAVYESLTSGLPLMSGLKTIILSVEDEKKDMILSYANTMNSDYIQAAQDEAAYESGELFWEFVGPEDDNVRDACLDLLSIRYFTNTQRKIAERLTATDRAFDCRHTFVQITRESYYENTPDRDSLINDAKNPEMVTKILNG